ncbi:MAG: hypothetical protein ITG01_09570 [Comamonas sp.]|nr:hypothetical protein [Comamonas sp.]
MISGQPTPQLSAQPLEDLLRAHAQSSLLMAIYLIGGGALLAFALLALAYMGSFSAALRSLPYVAVVAALLWLAIGGYVVRRHNQVLQAYNQVYDASLQRLAQARSKPQAASGWQMIANLFQQAAPATRLAAQGPRVYARPLSLFGACSEPQRITVR